jgi:2,3-dihydroxyphenylpropionate 1,2-dioxygenase
MSEIIGLVAMSHAPFATLLPPRTASEPGGRFLADAARVGAAVTRLAPDAVVVIGPDHFHANFYDMLPPFILGVEEAEAFGDFGSRSGPLPVAAELAWPIRDALANAGFDLALSYTLTVDHGVVQSYDIVCGDIPLVPLVVNTAAPPLPSLQRCAALGVALGAAAPRFPAGCC